jgi:hypothetical protein
MVMIRRNADRIALKAAAASKVYAKVRDALNGTIRELVDAARLPMLSPGRVDAFRTEMNITRERSSIPGRSLFRRALFSVASRCEAHPTTYVGET